MKTITATTTPRVRPSMFLQGLTGAGKSTWATTGGTPLVVLTEPKAESVLRQINPNAVGLVPESLEDLDALMHFLGNPEKTERFDRIILDSFTELTLAAPRWIQARAGRSGVLAKLELSEFGHLRDYALAVVKAIQLTGLPSVIIGRSTSKRVGLAERIVPDGLGKSVEELPGKLLPTAEARFDAELGYVIDTTPADHSQRCGLPWVPAVYQGTCLDYLRIIEAGPQQEAPCATDSQGSATAAESSSEQGKATSSAAPAGNGGSSTQTAASKPEPKSSPAPKTPKASAPEPAPVLVPPDPPADPAWVTALTSYAAVIVHLPEADRKAAVAEWERQYAANPESALEALQQYLAIHGQVRAAGIDPEVDPKGYQQSFGRMCAEMQAQKIDAGKAQEHSAEVEAFVEGVSPECAAPDDVATLLDLAREHKVNLDALWKYALSRDAAKACPDGSKNWNSLSKKFVVAITPQLTDAGKRRVFIPSIHQKFA